MDAYEAFSDNGGVAVFERDADPRVVVDVALAREAFDKRLITFHLVSLS